MIDEEDFGENGGSYEIPLQVDSLDAELGRSSGKMTATRAAQSPRPLDAEETDIGHTREEFGYAPFGNGTDPAQRIVSATTTAASFDSAASGCTGSRKPKPAFKLYSVGELLSMPVPKSLVRGVLRLQQIALIFGDPGAYKTFLVLDLVLKIGTGLTWWGRPTLKGSAVYCAGEGIGGLRRRLRAWAFEHRLDPRELDLRVLPHSVPFDSDEEFDRLIRALQDMLVKPLAVVIDTLARYGGALNENDAAEMGLFIRRCERIAEVTGAAVIVVHHTRKNSRVLRGSSALEAAADVVIEVTKPQTGRAEVSGIKSKDDEALPLFHLNTAVIPLGKDEHGEVVSSLVLRAGEAPANTPKNSTDVLTDHSLGALMPARDPAQKIRDTLANLFHGEASGSALLKASGLPSSTLYDTLKREIREGRIKSIGEPRRLRYRLTTKPTKSVTPTPTPGESPEPDPECGAHFLARPADSDSGGDTPLKGVSPDPEPESRAEGEAARGGWIAAATERHGGPG